MIKKNSNGQTNCTEEKKYNESEELIEKISEKIEMMFEYGEISEFAYLEILNLLEKNE